MIDEAINVLQKRTWADGERGIRASFFSINDTWGVKLYKNQLVADNCYAAQLQAIDYGIAPRLGDSFTYRWNGQTVYGFITEKAKVAAMYVCEALGAPHMGYYQLREHGYTDKFYELVGYSLNNFGWNEELRNGYKELKKLINEQYKANENDEELKKFFRNCLNDLHCYNWGMLEGRPVIIDFSFG